LHELRSQLKVVAVAISLICGSSLAQLSLAQSQSSPTPGDSFAAVRLEPHVGQTHFKLGDPIILDLVFTGASPSYVVKTDNSPYLPPTDKVDILPDTGWTRTRNSVRGLPLNLNALATLDGEPIRIPVLVNRIVTFLNPGHYEVTLTTERLRISETLMKAGSTDKCDVCRKTNSVGIDIAERDPAQEPELVASLTRTIDETKETPLENPLTAEQQAQMQHEISEMQVGADLSDEDRERDHALLEKWNETIRGQAAAIEQRREARRDAALRLACLDGDDAVRAKIRFIATSGLGDPDSVDWLMLNGLSSSSNRQLQLDLLEQAWRNPQNVPTYQLQTALRQARQLAHGQIVTDEPRAWTSTPEERQARLKELQNEIDALVASLPQRTEENRARTIAYLKGLGVPNQFNTLKASR
jgi:hypothetical protein